MGVRNRQKLPDLWDESDRSLGSRIVEDTEIHIHNIQISFQTASVHIMRRCHTLWRVHVPHPSYPSHSAEPSKHINPSQAS